MHVERAPFDDREPRVPRGPVAQVRGELVPERGGRADGCDSTVML